MIRRQFPSLRKHKNGNFFCALQENKKRVFYYFGKGPEAHRRYRELEIAWLKRKLTQTAEQRGRLLSEHLATVSDLILSWLEECKRLYLRPDGRIGEEASAYRSALRPLNDLYGETTISEFGLANLEHVRRVMVDKKWTRGSINRQVRRICAVFAWGVGQRLVPSNVPAELNAIRPLRKGAPGVEDPGPVRPVQEWVVDETVKYLHPIVRGMVTIQRHTGMRSDELVQMRACDIERPGRDGCWIYRPASHKNAGKGIELAYPLGPVCQGVLQPLLDAVRSPAGTLFDPRGCYKKPHPATRDHYDPDSYRRHITRAIDKANKERAKTKLAPLPHWFPHQQRHAWLTDVRLRFGAEAARASVGHKHLSTTEIYAERDLGEAIRVAKVMG